MSEPRDAPAPVDDPVDALIAELLARAEDDAGSDTGTHLDALCAEHPAQAATLRRRAGLLAELGVLTPPVARGDTDGTVRPVDGGGLPERLGPYRLLHPLGAGGMGVVYLAEQPELGRRVAVKVVRPEHVFFPGARERFRREVETVARLQHPGIAPIYSIGEDGGVPWFAMEYVRGGSLADVLDDLREHGPAPVHLTGHHLAEAVARCSPGEAGAHVAAEDAWLFAGTWEATCLRVVRHVADALEHAHRRGVVHRDLKPSNVMLAHDDTGGQVRLLDFGLAHRDGDDQASLTRTGSRLGSLPYMAPEQLRGADQADARTDVYALGVLLYELLTLRRPFDQTVETALLTAIGRGTAPAVRRLNPAVSWEAETVCLTAMDVDPGRRYASAADLARDLAAAEEHRPLEARRLGALPRARRWIERNPLGAVTALLAALLLVGVPLAFLARERQTSEAIREQLVRADAHFRRSLDAIDRMLTRVASDDLRHVPQVEPLRVALLEDAVALTEESLADEPDDATARTRAADSHERLGRLLMQLGRSDEGLAALERSLAMHDGVVAASSTPALASANRADVLGAWGESLGMIGRIDEAEAALREADAALAAAAETHPGEPALTLRRARNLVALGEVMNRRIPPEAPTADAPGLLVWRDAVGLFQQGLEQTPDDARALGDLGELLTAMAQLLLRPNEPPRDRSTERGLVEAAEQAYARAVTLDPEDRVSRFGALVARLVRAKTLKAEARFDDAEKVVRDTLPGLRELVREFPSVPEYHIELATALNEIGVLYDYRRSPPDAAEWYGLGVDELRVLAVRFPDLADLQSRAGQGEMNVGVARMNLGEHDVADDHFRRAIALQSRAVELAPGDERYPYRLRYHHMAHGDNLIDQARFEDAADAADRLAATIPDDWESHTQAGSQIARIVGRLARLPELDPDGARAHALVERAVAHLRRAVDAGFPMPGELGTARALDPLRGHPSFEALVAEVGDG